MQEAFFFYFVWTSLFNYTKTILLRIVLRDFHDFGCRFFFYTSFCRQNLCWTMAYRSCHKLYIYSTVHNITPLHFRKYNEKMNQFVYYVSSKPKKKNPPVSTVGFYESWQKINESTQYGMFCFSSYTSNWKISLDMWLWQHNIDSIGLYLMNL